jgi:hypothetical protein
MRRPPLEKKGISIRHPKDRPSAISNPQRIELLSRFGTLEHDGRIGRLRGRRPSTWPWIAWRTTMIQSTMRWARFCRKNHVRVAWAACPPLFSLSQPRCRQAAPGTLTVVRQSLAIRRHASVSEAALTSLQTLSPPVASTIQKSIFQLPFVPVSCTCIENKPPCYYLH